MNFQRFCHNFHQLYVNKQKLIVKKIAKLCYNNPGRKYNGIQTVQKQCRTGGILC